MSEVNIRFAWEHAAFGLEFDWLATDVCGKVAYFTTAGAGPVPVTIVASIDPKEDLYGELMRLQVTGSGELSKTYSHNVKDWIAIAERGFFAFDWRRNSRSYELIARPSLPISVDSIELQIIQNRALGVQLPLRLEEATELSFD